MKRIVLYGNAGNGSSESGYASKKVGQLVSPQSTGRGPSLAKLRLEWNFNSNHIEGNTLTYGETMLLLIKGRTAGDHDIREFEEMQAHDLALEMVRKWAKDEERPISEADIRDLNRIILVRPFYKPAVTPDEQSTQKRIIPGQYKETPNHVRLPIGKIFRYTEPEEVEREMPKGLFTSKGLGVIRRNANYIF